MAFLPETQGTRQSHTVFFQAREERKNTSAPGHLHRGSPGVILPGVFLRHRGSRDTRPVPAPPTVLLFSTVTGLHKHTA
jgi:hypothetical protein